MKKRATRHTVFYGEQVWTGKGMAWWGKTFSPALPIFMLWEHPSGPMLSYAKQESITVRNGTRKLVPLWKREMQGDFKKGKGALIHIKSVVWTPKQVLDTDFATSYGVLYLPLRGIVQLTNSATLAELEFHNNQKIPWQTNPYFIEVCCFFKYFQ